jgi:hypothetical protein
MNQAFFTGFALGLVVSPVLVLIAIAIARTSGASTPHVPAITGEPIGGSSAPRTFALPPRDQAPPGSPTSQLTLRNPESQLTSQQRPSRSRRAGPPWL